MAEKSYWEYRLKSADSGWRLKPYVFEETAFCATSVAAMRLQQENDDPESWEPVHHEQVDVRRVDLPLKWCAEHDQGSCVVKSSLPRGGHPAKQLVGQDNVRTLCRYYVHSVEFVKMGLPRCELCLELLFREAFERVKRVAQAWACNRINTKSGEITEIFWINHPSEVRLIEVVTGTATQSMAPVLLPEEELGVMGSVERLFRDGMPNCFVVRLSAEDWRQRDQLKWLPGWEWKTAVLVAPDRTGILRMARAMLLPPGLARSAKQKRRRKT